MFGSAGTEETDSLGKLRMPDLLIRIKKKTDGSAALSCIRADGSTTWQRQDGQQGRFFPLHDLTHYSVETVLGFHSAFFGLVASGWDISDFEKKEMRTRMPNEALLGELIVGLLDVERATGERSSADDCNWKIQTYHEEHGLPALAFEISDEQVGRIRAVRADLFARWAAVSPGDVLELSFTSEAKSAV